MVQCTVTHRTAHEPPNKSVEENSRTRGSRTKEYVTARSEKLGRYPRATPRVHIEVG